MALFFAASSALRTMPGTEQVLQSSTENRLVVTRGRGGGNGCRRQKAPTASYKLSKLWGCDVQRGDYSSSHYIVYLKVAWRVDLKSYHQKGINVSM